MNMYFHEKMAKWLTKMIAMSSMMLSASAWAACPVVDESSLIAATPGITLTLVVDKSSAMPGEELVYVLSFCNASDAPVSDLTIVGTTPASTTFISASCRELPPDITCSVSVQPVPGNEGRIEWLLSGKLLAGDAGALSFKVKVR